MSLSTRSFKINSICRIVNTVYPQCHPLPLTPSQLKEDLRQAKSAALGLKAQVEDMEQKILLLDGQLKEQGGKCKELASIRRQLEDQRALTQSQEQKVAQSLREAQQSQAELESLQAILSLLHLREVRRNIHTRPHCYVCFPVTCSCLVSYSV